MHISTIQPCVVSRLYNHGEAPPAATSEEEEIGHSVCLAALLGLARLIDGLNYLGC